MLHPSTTLNEYFFLRVVANKETHALELNYTRDRDIRSEFGPVATALTASAAKNTIRAAPGTGALTALT